MMLVGLNKFRLSAKCKLMSKAYVEKLSCVDLYVLLKLKKKIEMEDLE